MGPLRSMALFLVICGAAVGGCSETPPTLVFAAASLSDALEEAAEVWGQPVEFNFAGSNLLAQQIAAGAAPDVFIAADRTQMARLIDRGHVDPGQTVELLTNTLVVVVPAASDSPPVKAGARGLLSFARLAMADPQAVPAGVYARQWILRQGFWDKMEERVVPSLDVRAALSAVAAGHLPAGIVYATDAATSERVRVIYQVPPEEAPPICYYAALVKGRRSAVDSQAFLCFLRGAEGRRIFVRHGFGVLPNTGGPAASRTGLSE